MKKLSKKELEAVQKMHDHLVDLGAECSKSEKGAKPDDLQKRAKPEEESTLEKIKKAHKRGVRITPRTNLEKL